MPRLLLIVVLLVMLPLRSWASDTVAIQMAAPTSAVSAHATCHEAPAEASAAAHNHRTHALCASCALCHAGTSAAPLVPAPLALAPAPPHALPQTGNTHYTSVTVALRHKPPIS